ncbi:MAG TPA: hypothetical protein VER33_25150 [Polyangiaceae bacterium]|nr:hypothetical protein [Polyangiaceae bacterium]
MASSRVWSSVLMLALGVSMVASAQAQTLGGIGVTVGTNLQRREGRDQGLKLESITYADCIAGGADPAQWDYLEVPLTYSQSQGRKLQVWAGTDARCADDADRAIAGEGICWQVFTGDPVRELRLPVRRLLPGAGDATTPAICETAQQDQLTLFFMLVRGTSSDDTTVAQLEMDYDLIGPSAPTGVAVNAGEERLTLKWSSSDDESDRYEVFCEEALAPGTGGSGGSPTSTGGTAGTDSGGTAGTDGGGTAGASDGGTAATAGASGGNEAGGGAGTDSGAGADSQAAAGTSGGGTSGGTAGSTASGGSGGRSNNACGAATLRPGQRPPAALRRGRTSGGPGQGSTGSATGLKNFVRYACGVAALDESSNVGPLSELRCETPIEVTDYFEAYRRAGGTAGGGYCSFGQQPSGSWSLLGVAGLALAARRIRRGRSL